MGVSKNILPAEKALCMIQAQCEIDLLTTTLHSLSHLMNQKSIMYTIHLSPTTRPKLSDPHIFVLLLLNT